MRLNVSEDFMRKITAIALLTLATAVSISAQTTSRKNHVASRDTALNASAAAEPVEATAFSYPVDDFKPGVVRVGPPTTYLKEGLTVAEVIRLLGKPQTVSQRVENGNAIVTYEFRRGEARMLVAEFERGMLVRSRTETRGAEETADN
jgi:hypothetical protein